MKRGSLLVCYSSSEEEEDATSLHSRPTAEEPPAKKRKLPPLSGVISPPPPIDDPALHQGRTRTTPHVEGQWAAHIYVSIALRSSSPLFNLVNDVIDLSRKRVGTLEEIGAPEAGRRELHVSLSRPVFLRAHQRQELKDAVRNIARGHRPFLLSFAAFSELTNDEKTRTFLVLEVGAGHHELKRISDELTPTLEAIRQKGYYDSPRFHASIAWALLKKPPSLPNTKDHADRSNFVTIERIPEDLVSSLNETYCPILSSAKIGAFEVTELSVKIGKETTSFRLKGS